MLEAVPSSYSRPNHRPATPRTTKVAAAPRSCGLLMRNMEKDGSALACASNRLLRLDARELDVLAPLLDVAGEQLGREARVARERVRAEIVEELLRLLGGGDLVEPAFQLVDDGFRRVGRH